MNGQQVDRPLHLRDHDYFLPGIFTFNNLFIQLFKHNIQEYISVIKQFNYLPPNLVIYPDIVDEVETLSCGESDNDDDDVFSDGENEGELIQNLCCLV